MENKKYLKKIFEEIKKEFELIKFDVASINGDNGFLILFTNQCINVNLNKVLEFKQKLEVYFNDINLEIIYRNKRLEISFLYMS